MDLKELFADKLNALNNNLKQEPVVEVFNDFVLLEEDDFKYFLLQDDTFNAFEFILYLVDEYVGFADDSDPKITAVLERFNREELLEKHKSLSLDLCSFGYSEPNNLTTLVKELIEFSLRKHSIEITEVAFIEYMIIHSEEFENSADFYMSMNLTLN